MKTYLLTALLLGSAVGIVPASPRATLSDASPKQARALHPSALVAAPVQGPPYLSEQVHFANAAATAGATASAGTSSKAGLLLAGTLTLPVGKGPFPAVLLLSDQGAQDRDAVYDNYRFFAELADGLTKAGFAVLRYDDRGVGQSTGSLPSATPPDLATDAQAGLNFLQTRPDIDPTRLGLLGHGQGANVALLAAAGPLPPNFVVALAGYGVPVREALVQQNAALLRSLGADAAQVDATARRQRDMLAIISNMTDKAQTQAIVANMLRQDSPGMDVATAQASAAQMLTPAYRSFLDFDPQPQLGQVKCPVLLLNGTVDEQVDADINATALQKGLRNNRSVTAVKLSGVNHLLQPDPKQWPIIEGQARPVIAPTAIMALTSWLRRQTAR
ncbi:alpha/beta hydrolase family protein [Hymenobacter rubidus]|uniref:alpha/beta hydrolase family protein n=1 Tax=Hymenobacter rubidus TaxID=1441626 RepID=UPI00191E3C18|nr:alpha/beta fold hydrolase [Hymenobacter rubidus]